MQGLMDMNGENLVQLITIMSSIFIGVFVMLLSFFNQDMKALFYFIGILITFILVMILNRISFFREETKEGRKLVCDIFKNIITGQGITSPNTNTAFLAFTAVYFILPMIFIDMYNFPIIIFFVTLLLLDSFFALKNLCCGMWGIVTGGIVGAGMAVGLFYLLYSTLDLREYLYFGEVISNRVVCASKAQTFKCVARSS